MANGSLTMDAALRALDIGPGDEVIVSPRSYVASAMCVVLAGATPVFADVDPESGCITPATADAVRSPRTRAVIPVHIGGWPCDMQEPAGLRSRTSLPARPSTCHSTAMQSCIWPASPTAPSINSRQRLSTSMRMRRGPKRSPRQLGDAPRSSFW
jgi:hypothetical protein